MTLKKGETGKSPFPKGRLRGIIFNMLFYNPRLKQFARELRQNSTDAEIALWSCLRMKQLNGFQFYRQRIIGNYIVDFYCPAVKLIIEVDGSQHQAEEMIMTDRKRDDYLQQQGMKVLRFNDDDVLTNIEGVVEVILDNMKK